MLQTDGTAPYAPTKSVIAVIERHRQVGLLIVSTDTLMRMGIGESLAPRTVQAIRLLGLVDENGKPTSEFEAIRKAPTDQLPSLLAALIRDVYAPIFEVVDPTSASVSQLEDAFRGFTPSGQRPRMVSLFTGLMSYAGMISDVPKTPTGPKPKVSTKTTSDSKGRTGSRTPPAPPADPPPPPPPANNGFAYAVKLESGGTINVSMDVNLFTMSADDREYVMSLVDKVTGYNK
jgi:Family of unknown function (DUF5343)